MDKEYAIRSYEEASEHLRDLIEELKKSNGLGELDGKLRASVLEIYWHINKVWNARNVPQKEIDNSKEGQFDEWCQFPTDMEDI